MVEHRPWLTFLTHAVLLLGCLIIAFPIYTTFVASTHSLEAITSFFPFFPGSHLIENYHQALTVGSGEVGATVGTMMMNSLIMALGIALGKISISLLSAFAIVYFCTLGLRLSVNSTSVGRALTIQQRAGPAFEETLDFFEDATSGNLGYTYRGVTQRTRVPVTTVLRDAYVESGRLLVAAIGVATVNSLLESDEDACIELNAANLILERGRQKRIAIVGHFPFIAKVREAAEQLWVVEKNPREGDFSEAEAENLIPRAHIVAITGTALTNHTIEHLLELCDSKAYVVVLGDSAPLSPILFHYGVDAVSGTKVVDAALALRCVSEGANFRQIKGTRRLTMMR